MVAVAGEIPFPVLFLLELFWGKHYLPAAGKGENQRDGDPPSVVTSGVAGGCSAHAPLGVKASPGTDVINSCDARLVSLCCAAFTASARGRHHVAGRADHR